MPSITSAEARKLGINIPKGRGSTRQRSESNNGPDPMFMLQLREASLPEPVAEHRFHADREWRFDYAWPQHKVALEVEGGVWQGGRHNRGKGFLKDMEKYNAAALAGWMLLRTTPQALATHDTIEIVRQAIKVRPANLSVTPSQVEALVAIVTYREANGCNPTLAELGDRLSRSKVSIWERVQALIAKGLVEPSNRKARHTEPTAAGLEVVEQHRKRGDR